MKRHICNCNKWEKIETAPNDGGIYLVWGVGHIPYIAYEVNGNWLQLEKSGKNGRTKFPEPTHWMPLPNPPINDVLNYKEGEL